MNISNTIARFYQIKRRTERRYSKDKAANSAITEVNELKNNLHSIFGLTFCIFWMQILHIYNLKT